MMGYLYMRDITIVIIIITVYFIISSDAWEYFYHLSWCEVFQEKVRGSFL